MVALQRRFRHLDRGKPPPFFSAWRFSLENISPSCTKAGPVQERSIWLLLHGEMMVRASEQWVQTSVSEWPLQPCSLAAQHKCEDQNVHQNSLGARLLPISLNKTDIFSFLTLFRVSLNVKGGADATRGANARCNILFWFITVTLSGWLMRYLIYIYIYIFLINYVLQLMSHRKG